MKIDMIFQRIQLYCYKIDLDKLGNFIQDVRTWARK